MNFLKTTLLLAALTGLALAIGWVFGGPVGIAIAVVFVGVMNFVSFWWSDKIALRMAGAHEIEETDDPRLYNMVREVANLANMPMPKVYVVQSPSPNAFATGRNPSHAVVAVTTGIRQLLTDRELRGVIGHEMGHVKNRDILTSSIVATIAGAVSLIANIMLWMSIFGGNRNQNIFVILGTAILAPLAASLIQMGISRTREYAADKTGAEITHDPEALASALEKLHRGVQMIPMKDSPSQEAVSPLYIVHPFAGGGMSKLFSTHPPMEERIARLRKMVYGG